jgi:hypothetical protein
MNATSCPGERQSRPCPLATEWRAERWTGRTARDAFLPLILDERPYELLRLRTDGVRLRTHVSIHQIDVFTFEDCPIAIEAD